MTVPEPEIEAHTAARSEYPILNSRFHRGVIVVWAFEAISSTFIFAAALLGASEYLLHRSDSSLLDELPEWLMTVLALTWFAICCGAAFLRWKASWYSVDSGKIDVATGVINKRMISIPMVKVQNVSYKQNALLQILQLATVSVSTAAGSTEIPGISINDATNVQATIARLAQVEDKI